MWLLLGVVKGAGRIWGLLLVDLAPRGLDVILRRVVPDSTHQTPAAVGAFYYFNSLTNPINQPSIPGTMTNKSGAAFAHPVA